MIKIYFENRTHSELIAIFDSEETYLICYPSLKKAAKKRRLKITESLENNININDMINHIIEI